MNGTAKGAVESTKWIATLVMGLCCHIMFWLVVSTPLKNMGRIIAYILENKNVFPLGIPGLGWFAQH